MATADDFYTRKANSLFAAAEEFEFAANEAKALGNERAYCDFALMAAIERKAADREFALARAAGEK